MGSRFRKNVKHFFECFCEVVPKTNDKDAWIIQQYPDTYKDEEVLRSVPKFAYPCNFENNIVQHYSFVLTDIESKWTFGFCRHDPKTETALVVLSYLPWHQAFYKFLNNIAVLLHSPRSEDLRDFLYAVFSVRVPEPGSVFVVPFNKGESTFTCECPDKYKLPSIPENRNLTEYYNAVDANNMMVIFASMLNERRIIFTSRKLYRLSACVQSANDIIYPMIWQHIFIPVLPKALVDYLLAPMPFLIGVPYDILKTVHKPDVGDVVIFDADTNTIETPFDDLNSLPPEILSSLKRQLRNRGALLGDGVSRAFLRALVQLIGGYRDALRFQQGEDITFNEQAFIETRSITMQPFLKKMLQLQIFQQFIEERLQMLNKGEGFTDEFELEVHIYSEKSSSKLKQQYKEWTATMRKEGSAFFKSVKDKANPAVKTAVKSVKEGGKGVKSAYKGLKSKFRESQGPEFLERGIRIYTDGTEKPRSAPNSPTGKRRPLTTFGIPKASYRKEKTFISNVVERPYSPLSPLSSNSSNTYSPDSPDRSYNATPGLDIPTMDLLTEIKDLLQLQPDSPPIDRSLKPVRSLESFKHSSSTSPDGWAANSTTTATAAATPITIRANNTRSDAPHISPNNTLLPPPSSSSDLTSSTTPVKYQQHNITINNNNNSSNSSSSSSNNNNNNNTTGDSTATNNNGFNHSHSSFLSFDSSPLLSSSTITTTTTYKNNHLFDQMSQSTPNSLIFTTTPPPLTTSTNNTDSSSVSPLNHHHQQQQQSFTQPLTRPTPPRDLFGSTPFPFVVGGGQNENGDAVFLVASDNSVDMVKLEPPVYSPRRKKENKTEDLIRLDSSSSELDDFDPLLAKDRNQKGAGSDSSPESQSQTQQAPVFIKGLSNPLYTYCLPKTANGICTSTINGSTTTATVNNTNNKESLGNDLDLLQEYGLDFNSISAKFSNSNNSTITTTTSNNTNPNNGQNSCSSNMLNFNSFPTTTSVKSQNQWTTFE